MAGLVRVLDVALLEHGVLVLLAGVEDLEAGLVRLEVRVPDVDDEHEARLVGVVPDLEARALTKGEKEKKRRDAGAACLVLEAVVEEEAPALGPGPPVGADADAAAAAGGHGEAQVAGQP